MEKMIMTYILAFLERNSGHIIVGIIVAATIIDIWWLGTMAVNAIW